MDRPAFVTPAGQPFDMAAAERKASLKPRTPRADLKPRTPRADLKPRTGKDYEDFMSLGFVVEGLSREMLDIARDARHRAIAYHPTNCELAREMGLPEPKLPAPFDEAEWLRTAKRKKVRKPFEIRNSAEECRTLLLKLGWLVAEVSEIRRERKS
jgi:hypothetical protein